MTTELFKRKITSNFLIYGPVDSSAILWLDPINSNTFNNICINALSIHDVQEHLLLTISAEKYSDPSSRDKLAQITKEQGIKDIMNNTFVDKVNHKVSVKCLHTQELDKLGENFYGATKRVQALHVKISDKPEISKEIDDYMKEQEDNGNYIPIDVDESRKKFQLHFVGYNFVVSATSSSTKVRMTTDSSVMINQLWM